MADFDIDGVSYKSRMMDGQTQMLVMKRLLPTFTALVAATGAIERPEAGEEGGAAAMPTAALLGPVAEKLAAISDADIEFILSACMKVTERQAANGRGWAPVMQPGPRGPIVQVEADEKFATRLKIAWNVLGENFAGMFSSFGIDLQGLMASGVSVN